MYVRNSRGSESHAAAQEGELHKKSDDARAGGAEWTRCRAPTTEARATVEAGKETNG